MMAVPPPTTEEQRNMGNRETITANNWKCLPPPIGTRDPYGYKSSRKYYNKCVETMADDSKGFLPFLPSPTGQGYINTPEEMIVDWWISKLPFKEWYAKNFLQQTINFD